VGLQDDFDTIDGTISALSGSLGVTDGIVLGDRESGDFESGISVPSFVRERREVADVPGSFTPQADTFLRANTDGLEIAWHVKGNGATATPSADEAKPDAGIDALHEMAGLVGATGTNPEYDYTPRTSSTSGGATKYGTVKLWVGDLSWVLKSCTVSSLRFTVQPSGIIIATAALQVGSVNTFADSVSFPTFDYGNQASLSANTVESVTTSWGSARGWESLEIEIANAIEFAQDSAAPDGRRLIQTGRRINTSARLFVASGDSDFEYQEAIRTDAPTADLAFQLGAAAGAGDEINAVNFDMRNLQVVSMKPAPVGEVLVAEIEGHSTATTAGEEAKFTYN
tara:strand:+ start:7310 stop:8329 length:1020 start_codon:yes stop_codon:yes gene_type:complete